MTFLKSKAANEYLCYNTNESSFVMTNLSQINIYCVFIFEAKYGNEYKFYIGSVENRLVFLSFDRMGHLIYNNKLLNNSITNPNKCRDSTMFSLNA